MFAIVNIGDGALLVFLPHRAAELGLGADGYGFLVAATTAGELLAALLLARRPWRASLRAWIAIAQITAAPVVLLLVIDSTAVTVAALVALGICAAPMTAWAQSLRMRLVPPEAHGRLFALLRTTMQATPPAGATATDHLSGKARADTSAPCGQADGSTLPLRLFKVDTAVGGEVVVMPAQGFRLARCPRSSRSPLPRTPRSVDTRACS